MNPIQKTIELLRELSVTTDCECMQVSAELEAMLKQESVAEYIAECEVARIAHIPIGTRLYAATVSAEPVNARLLALLTGLEADPLFAQAEPQQLLELGKAIAAQAKEAAEQAKPAPEPSVATLTDERIAEIISEIDFRTMVTASDVFYLIARAIERELRGEGK